MNPVTRFAAQMEKGKATNSDLAAALHSLGETAFSVPMDDLPIAYQDNGKWTIRHQEAVNVVVAVWQKRVGF